MTGFRRSSSRVHLERFVAEASKSVPAGSRTLDAGAGDAPYAPLFTEHRHESADFAQVSKPYSDELTYVCDLAAMPVADCRYDLVVLTQVLEHIPEPVAVLREMNRVLKPGAALWFSTPLFYEEHEQPYDFYRYTQFGLRTLSEKAGFDVERLEWLEGYLGTLGYQLRMAGSELPTTPVAYGNGVRGLMWALAVRVARPFVRRIGERLDQLDQRTPYTQSGMPKNYQVVARKRN